MNRPPALPGVTLTMIDRFYTQLREAVIEREGILNLVEIGE